MKQILIFLYLITAISCRGETYNLENVELKYSYWKKCFEESVAGEIGLFDYQKENLIEVSRNLSLARFKELRRGLFDTREKKEIDKEYYLLELSEGEVLTSCFYYIVESDGHFKFASMMIYGHNEGEVNLRNSNYDIDKFLDLKPINQETLDDRLLVLITFDGDKVSSIIGSK